MRIDHLNRLPVSLAEGVGQFIVTLLAVFFIEGSEGSCQVIHHRRQHCVCKDVTNAHLDFHYTNIMAGIIRPYNVVSSSLIDGTNKRPHSRVLSMR